MCSSIPCCNATLNLALLFLLFVVSAAGHGLLDWPNTRGGLTLYKNSKEIDKKAPPDYHIFFPAGDKSLSPRGAGGKSQVIAGKNNWMPFEPQDPDFVWRAGVCGDLRDPNNPQKGDHMRGGKYYYPPNKPYIIHTFRPGEILDATVKITGHHNGFLEFHLCDVQKCGGEISEECFRKGHCRQLLRALTPECQSGKSLLCGPRDEKYPGRWYLPCTSNTMSHRWDHFGPGTMQYIIPRDFQCDHCVLHWFWSTANTCNPPGVIDYFDGPNKPNWGDCKGESGAVGGVARQQRPCGGPKFAEEYMQCADIAVKGTPVGEKSGSETIPRALPKASQSVAPLSKDNSVPDFDPPVSSEETKESNTAVPSSSPVSIAAAPSSSPVVKAPVSAPDSLTKKSTTNDQNGAQGLLSALWLISHGKTLGQVYHGDVMDANGLDKVTFEVTAAESVSSVKFSIIYDGRVQEESVETERPFRMFSGRNPPYWERPVLNKKFDLKVSTTGDNDVYNLELSV